MNMKTHEKTKVLNRHAGECRYDVIFETAAIKYDAYIDV